MSLEADAIAYQRSLKRRLIFWRVLGVAALVAVVAALFGRFDGVPGVGAHIARVEVSGVIVEDAFREDVLAELAEDDSVKALLVRINSPGGTVVGGDTLFRSLRRLAEAKPVVAVMGELATSGGYMAALGADKIFANQGSLTGSIGVILQTTEVTGLLDKIGVKAESIKSAPLKAAPNPLEPMTEDVRAATQAVVMDMYDMFVGMVIERRGMEPAQAKELADGRVFTGRQALNNGLIDALGGEREALDWLETEREISAELPLKDVSLERPEAPWNGFFGQWVGKTLFSERVRLDGLVAVWHPKL